MIYVVDTHALIWFLEGSKRLGGQAREILRDEHKHLLIPSIVLAEAKDLVSKGKTRLIFDEILEAITDPRCLSYPLDLAVVRAMPRSLDIHDAIICATALVYQKTVNEEALLITRDESLIKSNLVKTVW